VRRSYGCVASATDAERHSAWAQAQETVQSEVEQKLRQLEALRLDAEREP
jgi:hypothetical protein